MSLCSVSHAGRSREHLALLAPERKASNGHPFPDPIALRALQTREAVGSPLPACPPELKPSASGSWDESTQQHPECGLPMALVSEGAERSQANVVKTSLERRLAVVFWSCFSCVL